MHNLAIKSRRKKNEWTLVELFTMVATGAFSAIRPEIA